MLRLLLMMLQLSCLGATSCSKLQQVVAPGNPVISEQHRKQPERQSQRETLDATGAIDATELR